MQLQTWLSRKEGFRLNSEKSRIFTDKSLNPTKVTLVVFSISPSVQKMSNKQRSHGSEELSEEISNRKIPRTFLERSE